MTGLGLLLRKELQESWRTLRMPVALALFAAVGLMSPLLAKYLPQIVEAAGAGQLGSIELPTPTTADAVQQLARNLLQFGSLTAILLSMGSVATEKERGTAAFVVTRSIGRPAFVVSKVVALGSLLAVGCAIAVALAWTYTAILFEPVAIVGWIAFWFMAWIGLSVFAAITFAASVMTRSATVAAGIGLGALLLLSLASALPTIGQLTPTALLERATSIAITPDAVTAEAVLACVACGGAIAVLVAVSIGSFGRQEL